jgi:hypothetical protein
MNWLCFAHLRMDGVWLRARALCVVRAVRVVCVCVCDDEAPFDARVGVGVGVCVQQAAAWGEQSDRKDAAARARARALSLRPSSLRRVSERVPPVTARSAPPT